MCLATKQTRNGGKDKPSVLPDMHRELLGRIDPAEVARVCADLVQINTSNPPGRERAAAEYVAAYLGPDFEANLLPYPGDDSRASVVCRLPCKHSGKPSLVFNGHLDVVPVGAQPWRYAPFDGTIADDRVWGRGSSDMKSGVAAMLVAARALASARALLRGDLVLAMTAGEEVGMTGAQQVAAWPELGRVAAIIIAEPTDNTVGLAERGVLWIELATQGKTAHGSTPHLGRNAINMMRKLLDAVDRSEIPFVRHPLLGDFTYSLDTIEGGTVNNVVPDRCVASLDLRTVPGQDHDGILRHFEELIAEVGESEPGFSAEVSSPFSLPPVETPAGHPAVAGFTAAVQAATGEPAARGVVRFATEAAIFVPALNVPAIVFGPGNPDLAHQPDENVAISKMLEAAQVYAAAALLMLG